MDNCPHKILIVDDNEPIRGLLKSACSFYGFNTECVTNGQEAVDAFEKNRNCKRTPIIAISGTTESNPHQMCLEAGMDGFIPKPIEISDMVEIIKTVADS